jgi:outer membrane receptor protein involved in Fe transport
MSRNSEIARAVRHALLSSAIAAAAVNSVPVFAQEQQEPTRAENEGLTVTVTGSRIRRVDEETASPVFVLDQGAIQASGVTTLGDLVQRVPSIAGAATNPQVNNGGGSGESNVELRGLGAQRTLVLLNGRRIGVVSNVQTTVTAVDINMIPVNMVERVEVLKEGAGAIYGSDAIAGVVNFITRKNFEGAEVNLQFGSTAENDGDSQSAGLLFGVPGDRFNVMFGGNYNKQDEISANDRDFSRFALYLYGGAVSAVGSSRTPRGRINLPEELADEFGCPNISRNEGAAGSSLSDYHCYTNAGDSYNFQPFNLLMTPQERSSLFTFGTFELHENVEAYADVIYSSTRSRSIIAPLPFDATQDDTTISANSVYNPFGTDFGGILGLNPNVRVRLEALGNRETSFNTDSIVANAGLRGALPKDWEWDLNVGYGRMDQDRNVGGYLFAPALRQAVGPSFIAPDGTPTCGTPAAPIAGCTPINIFNVQDPAQIAFLQGIQTNYTTDYVNRNRSYSLNLNGPVFELPAGSIQAAVGAEYRDLQGAFTTDILTRAQPPTFLSCLLAQETCTGNASAKYNVRELYGELFVPILAERPGVRALNAILGIRYSDYSRETIGDSTNAQFKLEYRPVADVLLRASYAEVFRAPTINDLSLAPSQDAPTFNDPCVGLTNEALAANPNLGLACQGVVPDGTFEQQLSQITGVFIGSPDLEPETGDVTTFGFVYDSSVIPGLSLNVDYWSYQIDDLITGLDPNFAIQNCVSTGQPQFCGLVFRYTDPASANLGQIQSFLEPIVNLGELETDGIDFGVKYALRDTRIGSFQFSLDATRLNSYENTPAPGAVPVEIAGTYDRQFGNYAKWRGLLGVGWKMAGFDGLLTSRYIHSIEVVDPDGAPDVQPNLEVGSTTYFDLTAGYTFPTDTRVQLGVTNLTDKQPPLLYQNNVINANTDVSTYDLLGRRYFVSFVHTF